MASYRLLVGGLLACASPLLSGALITAFSIEHGQSAPPWNTGASVFLPIEVGATARHPVSSWDK